MSQNPYIGLRPFESKDSLYFFGRQKQNVELLERLHHHKFLAVVGSSGSGKSSLIRAGLIPRLQAGYLVEDRSDWVSVIMKPGQNPLFHLAQAILQSKASKADSETLKKEIRELGVDGILDFLRPLFENKDTNYLLLVDQFEELFRFASGDAAGLHPDGHNEEAIDFVNILLALADQEELPIYVVITMRSDFIGDCVKFYGLPEALNKSQYLVPRLNRVQRKSAIEGPAKLIGEKINSSLVSKLLNDVESEQDELPLLQHALMRVWDHEKLEDQNGELDLEDYKNIGGLKKALSNHADEIIEALSKKDLLLVRKMFQALTMIDENGRKIRRPCRLSELVSVTKSDNAKLGSLIDEFIKDGRSFLVRSSVENDPNDEMIDISHESLIRQWGTLQKWVDDESKAAETYRNLTRALALNIAEKRDFLSELEILEVRSWQETFKPEASWANRYDSHFEDAMGFYGKSEKALAEFKEKEKIAENRRRRLKKVTWVAVLIGVLAIFSITLGIFAFVKSNEAQLQSQAAEHQRIEAEKQTAKAEEQTRRALEAQAESDQARAEEARQRQKADSIGRIAQAQQKAIADQQVKEASLAARAAQREAAVAERERKVAEVERLRERKLKEAYLLITTAVGIRDPSVSIRVAQEANKVGSDSLINNLLYKIFRENVFYRTIPFEVNEDSYYEVKLLDNSIWVLDSEEGRLSSYDLEGNRLHIFGETFVNSFDVSADGKNVVTGEDDLTARIWNSGGDLISTLQGHSEAVYLTKFSPGGQHVLTGTYYSDPARIWNLDGSLNQTIKLPEGFVQGSFSPSGKYLAIADGNGHGLIYKRQFSKYNLAREIIGEEASVESLNYIDESTLVLESLDYSEQSLSFLYDPIKEDTIHSFKTNIFLSASDKHILTTDYSSLSLYHLKSKTTEEIEGRTIGGFLSSSAISPNGQGMVSIDGNGLKFWDLKGSAEDVYDLFSSDYYISKVDVSTQSNQLIVVSFQKISIIDLNQQEGTTSIDIDQLGGAVSYSADQSTIYATSGGEVRVLDVQGKEVTVFEAHDSDIDLVVSTVDNHLVTVSESLIRRWTTKGKLLQETNVTANYTIANVDVSADGKLILTSSFENIDVWDSDGNKLESYSPRSESYGQFTSAALIGKEVVAVDDQLYLYRWEVNPNPDTNDVNQNQGFSSQTDSWTDLSYGDENQVLEELPHYKRISHDNFSYSQFSDISTKTQQVLVYLENNLFGLLDLDGNLLHEYESTMEGYVEGLYFSSDSKKIIAHTSSEITIWDNIPVLSEYLKSGKVEPLTEEQKEKYGIK